MEQYEASGVQNSSYDVDQQVSHVGILRLVKFEAKEESSISQVACIALFPHLLEQLTV